MNGGKPSNEERQLEQEGYGRQGDGKPHKYRFISIVSGGTVENLSFDTNKTNF